MCYFTNLYPSCIFQFYQVIEDNITDAVKINIQQEVAVLQNRVKYLENENNKLFLDLHNINDEKTKLLKIKDKFLAMTEERITFQTQLEASELKASSNKV